MDQITYRYVIANSQLERIQHKTEPVTSPTCLMSVRIGKRTSGHVYAVPLGKPQRTGFQYRPIRAKAQNWGAIFGTLDEVKHSIEGDDEGPNGMEYAAEKRAEAERGEDGDSQGPEFIDLTPESLKTPEGRERVRKAQDQWDDASHALANFVSNNIDSLIDLPIYEEALELVQARTAKQDAFLKAVAGR